MAAVFTFADAPDRNIRIWGVVVFVIIHRILEYCPESVRLTVCLLRLFCFIISLCLGPLERDEYCPLPGRSASILLLIEVSPCFGPLLILVEYCPAELALVMLSSASVATVFIIMICRLF